MVADKLQLLTPRAVALGGRAVRTLLSSIASADPSEQTNSVISSLNPSMHPVLQISEVLHVIFSSFVARPLGRGDEETDSQTLLALALTCRAFRDPAIDALWTYLHALSQLIMCLPENMHVISNNRCLLNDLLKPCDWVTIQKYAARIRSVSFTEANQQKSSRNFEILGFSPSSTPLFSNLTHLTWRGSSQNIFPFIKLFVGSPLQFLNLSLPTATIVELTFIATLGSLYPKLKHLRVDIPDKATSQLIDHSLLECLSGLEELEIFACNQFPSGSLHVLSHCTKLRDMHLRLEPVSSNNGNDSGSFRLELPSLRGVFLTAQSLGTITSFFDKVIMIHPKVVHVQGDSMSHTQALEEFFDSLASHCSLETMLEVQVKILSEGRTLLFPYEFALQMSHMASLTAFTNIKRVVVDIPQGCSLNDGDLIRMATAWPNLEALSLNRERGWLAENPSRMITLAGFINLLRLCPLLKDVAIAFDADQSSGIDLVHPGRGAFNTNIRQLRVLNSKLTKASRVALILHGILPRLEAVIAFQNPVDGVYPYKKEHIHLWDIVNEELHFFRVVKEQLDERQRLGLL